MIKTKVIDKEKKGNWASVGLYRYERRNYARFKREKNGAKST